MVDRFARPGVVIDNADRILTLQHGGLLVPWHMTWASLSLAPRDGALDGVEQGVGIKRLRENRERTAGRKLGPDLLVANGGREDDRDGKASVQECLPKLQAVHAGQGEIQD